MLILEIISSDSFPFFRIGINHSRSSLLAEYGIAINFIKANYHFRPLPFTSELLKMKLVLY